MPILIRGLPGIFVFLIGYFEVMLPHLLNLDVFFILRILDLLGSYAVFNKIFPSL